MMGIRLGRVRASVRSAIRSISSSLAECLAAITGDLAYWLFRDYREGACANLARVLGTSTDAPRVRAAARLAFRAAVRNFAALAALHLTRGRWRPRIQLDVADDGTVLSPRDILVSAHLGPFDVVAAMLARDRFAIVTIAGPLRPKLLGSIVSWLRSAPSLSVLPVTPGGLRRAIRAWRNGRWLVLLLDRDLIGRGQQVAFFGVPTRLPDGPIRLAQRLGCRVRPVFCYRTSQGYRVRFGRPLAVPVGNSPETARRVLQEVVHELEAAIRAAPDQWLVFSPVWND